jgi:hypothetical protein
MSYKRALPERTKTEPEALDRMWGLLHGVRASSSTVKVKVDDLRNLLQDFAALMGQFSEPDVS